MVQPVSISSGVQFYRLRNQTDKCLLKCDSETWFQSVYSIAGLVCRDKTIRLLSNPKTMSSQYENFLSKFVIH